MMAQITIYLNDRLATAARKHARNANKSLSAWIASILERETGTRTWSKEMRDLLTKGSADIVEPEDFYDDDEDVKLS